jgi:hypothetical protein
MNPYGALSIHLIISFQLIDEDGIIEQVLYTAHINIRLLLYMKKKNKFRPSKIIQETILIRI